MTAIDEALRIEIATFVDGFLTEYQEGLQYCIELQKIMRPKASEAENKRGAVYDLYDKYDNNLSPANMYAQMLKTALRPGATCDAIATRLAGLVWKDNISDKPAHPQEKIPEAMARSLANFKGLIDKYQSQFSAHEITALNDHFTRYETMVTKTLPELSQRAVSLAERLREETVKTAETPAGVSASLEGAGKVEKITAPDCMRG